jgi:hypothetical protein
MNESSFPIPPSGEHVEQPTPLLCPVCHEPVRPEFYFCPNCGKNLKEKPLSTSLSAQISIYFFSIITPPMCFLTIKWWHGVKYMKADNPKAKEIGLIAIVLLALSTAVTAWLLYALTAQLMQSLSAGLLGGPGSGL